MGRRIWGTLFREITYLDTMRWTAPKSLLPELRQAKLNSIRDRAYARYDAAKERTAAYSVVANGAGLVTSIAFLAERDSLTEGASLIALPILTFAIGLGLGFFGLYLGELYRRLQVKTIDASLNEDEERRATLRQLRKAVSAVLRTFRLAAILSFSIGVVIATSRAWDLVEAPEPAGSSQDVRGEASAKTASVGPNPRAVESVEPAPSS